MYFTKLNVVSAIHFGICELRSLLPDAVGTGNWYDSVSRSLFECGIVHRL
ncbi:MAG: hypothetical protein RMY28_024485 [Nostoc sp. ChiSLP01]|nr:hypothetical protein [Nostoc sp. CmiSLP01]MDZ8282593.1 hypothetical protein [Nostoc sp. ChiSLP01]